MERTTEPERQPSRLAASASVSKAASRASLGNFSSRNSTAWLQHDPASAEVGAIPTSEDHVQPFPSGSVAGTTPAGAAARSSSAGASGEPAVQRRPMKREASRRSVAEATINSSRPASARLPNASPSATTRGEALLQPSPQPPDPLVHVPSRLRSAATDSVLSAAAAERAVYFSTPGEAPSRRESRVSRVSLGGNSDTSGHKSTGQSGITSPEQSMVLPPPHLAMLGHSLAGTGGAHLRPASWVFPMADPDYDETAVPEAAELAAKYGGAWLRAVLPSRAPAAHPLQMASVRHVDGSISIVHADHVRPLQAGCSLFVGGEAHLTALHQHLPKGLHYIPANMYDWGTAEPRYMTVHFAAPGHLFVLLPEDTVEPRWLRKQFHKLREPLYGIKVALQCHWSEGGIGEMFVRLMTASRKADKHGHLLVYKSKRLYHTGDVEHLGGVPTAHFIDSMYILCAGFATQYELEHEIGAGADDLTDNIHDWVLWYPRMLKSIRRNRLEDVRVLLKSDAWTQRPFRNDPISWLPPDEVDTDHHGSPLTSDLAVGFGNVEMLALLVAECHCQLSVRGLRLLVHKWEEVPEEQGGALELLLGYLRRCPRPLGTVACILATLRREIERRDRARSSSTLELRAVLRRFEELQTQLLYALADVVRHRGHHSDHDSQSLAWLQAVVDPPQHPRPLVLADHSPLRIAFDDRDFGFMASVVMEGYTRQKWMGTALLALTSRDGTGGLTILDPSILLTVMRRLGLCDDGILAAALFRVARLWYLCCVVPAAFIASARGRWWMKLMSCTAFIVIFNVTLAQDASADLKSAIVTAGFFCAFLLGNLVEAVESIAVAYQGSISRFAHRNPQELLLLVVEALALGLTITYMLQMTDTIQLSEVLASRLLIVWASLAVAFYVKFLYTLVPLVQRLGPLLNTVMNMMSELSAFLLPFIVVTAGFATSYHIIFNGINPSGMNNFGDSMLMLFQAFLTSFDMSRWDEMPRPEYRLFGILMLSLYLVLAGILLANLLIAIISYKYRPDEVAAQSIFGLAEVVDRHQLQVDTALLCSPFCLLQIPFNLLPHGTRPAILPYSFFRLGLAPLEGFRPAAPHLNTVPTGRDAVPQLLFHLTLHPIMLVATNLVFYALSPLCVIYFTWHGYKEVWDQLWPSKHGHRPGASGRDMGAGPGLARQQSRAGNTGFSMQLTTLSANRSFGSRRISASFESEHHTHAMGILHARSGDPWIHMKGYFSLQGIYMLVKAISRTVAAFLFGVLLCYGPIGLVLVTIGGTWMWLACIALSMYNVLYEPVVRVAEALAWQQWRRRMRRSAVMDGGPHHDAGSATSQHTAASANAEHADAAAKRVSASGLGAPGLGTSEHGASEQRASEHGASEQRASEHGGTSGGEEGDVAHSLARSMTAGQVAHKWILLAKRAARRGVTAGRYLARQQVDAAIAKTFGYSISTAVGATAPPGGAKAGKGSVKPSAGAGSGAKIAESAPDSAMQTSPRPAVMRLAGQQQEARDFAVLGRALPGEGAGPSAGPSAGSGGAVRRQARSATAAAGEAGTAGGVDSGPSAAEGQQGDASSGDFRIGDPSVSREALYSKLEQQESELQSLRSQVLIMADLLSDRLAYADGREEARQQRRSVLFQAYGDENY